jgi:periplasmic protein TonB
VTAFALQDKSELRRWVLCGAFVLAAHALGAAALVQWHEPIDDGDYGEDTVMLELTPQQEQGNPTPDQPIEKPIEEPIAPLPEQQSEAMLPVKPPDPVEMPVPVQNNAPDLVTTAAQQARLRANRANWDSEIARLLEHNKRYPAEARARGEQGVVELKFSIDREGHLLSSHIVRSSGFAALDEETLALVQRAQPFPPPPPDSPGEELSFTVPVRFNIR